MPFSDSEIQSIAAEIEDIIWSKHRPPLRLRDQVREGQRISGYAIELFFSRPLWDNRDEHIEESIAKIKYVKKHDHWRLYWQRADLKWHAYPKLPIANSLSQALQAIDADEYCCFWG